MRALLSGSLLRPLVAGAAVLAGARFSHSRDVRLDAAQSQSGGGGWFGGGGSAAPAAKGSVASVIPATSSISPPLHKEADFDVAVVGGGIIGLA